MSDLINLDQSSLHVEVAEWPGRHLKSEMDDGDGGGTGGGDTGSDGGESAD